MKARSALVEKGLFFMKLEKMRQKTPAATFIWW